MGLPILGRPAASDPQRRATTAFLYDGLVPGGELPASLRHDLLVEVRPALADPSHVGVDRSEADTAGRRDVGVGDWVLR
jgi:hypothetical protein